MHIKTQSVLNFELCKALNYFSQIKFTDLKETFDINTKIWKKIWHFYPEAKSLTMATLFVTCLIVVLIWTFLTVSFRGIQLTEVVVGVLKSPERVESCRLGTRWPTLGLTSGWKVVKVTLEAAKLARSGWGVCETWPIAT